MRECVHGRVCVRVGMGCGKRIAVVVIGGGVGNVDEIYSDLLYEKLEKLIFNEHVNTKIIKPSLGDSAGVFGAALLIK